MAPGTPGGTPALQEPLLEAEDIQGNILAGFNKDHQLLMALKIRDVPTARRWLKRILPRISSTAEVHLFNSLFRRLRARLGNDPAGLVATWTNIAFSREGLATLLSTAEAAAVPDPAFVAGLPARARGLGDPIAPGQTDPTLSWVVGGTGRVPDMLLIVASDDAGYLKLAVERLRPQSLDGPEAPEVIWEELGETRPDLPGHEHFGFKDGISQPGLRGLLSRQPDVYLTRRLLQPSPPQTIDFASPGQPLIWPGQFVFGYPFQDKATGDPLPLPDGQPAWLRNGSFLVFRRLRQDVAAFSAFLRTRAAELAATAAFPQMTPEHLGALIMGRWPSGAPVPRTPDVDRPDLAGASLANNDFLFTTDTPPPDFQTGVGTSLPPFPPAHEDSLGLVCPHAAHIRKMNPRDQDSDLGDPFDTLPRRVLRRGIPFGPPLHDPTADDGVERGLHFLCYQASIEGQFETLQSDWANSAKNPNPGGNDLVIGQDRDHPRTLDLFSPGGADSSPVTPPVPWVIPTGGGYFFAPSIRVIRDLLSAAPAGTGPGT
jgi:Dyp-type peroxidase family